MQTFLTELADLLELEVSELTENYELESNENWDSLTLISVIVMIDEHFKLSLPNDALRNCENLSDLLNLINKK